MLYFLQGKPNRVVDMIKIVRAQTADMWTCAEGWMCS